MKSLPTIHDLAADLNISATTVWRALNNRDRISSATRKRILARAAAIHYAPSLVAQNLSRGRTQTLGVVVPMVDHPVFASLLEKIEEAAFNRGYNVMLCDARLSMARENEYARMLLRRRVEGVIVVPFAERTTGWDVHLVELQKRNVPVILLEQDLPTDRFTKVVADTLGATYALTRYLIDLRAPGLCSPGSRMGSGRQRASRPGSIRQWRSGPGKKSQTVTGCICIQRESRCGNTSARRSSIALAARTGRRLFFAHDMLAIHAMQTLREMELRIPADVAVAGFDNIAFSQFTQPPLTTVEQPIAEMGRRAAEIL